MTREEKLYAQIESKLTDYLRTAGIPLWEPALSVCPNCGEHASILVDRIWYCPQCQKKGDVVDYVMLQMQLDKKTAITHICHTLNIKVTTLDVIGAHELMDKQFVVSSPLVAGLLGQGIYLLAGAPKIGKSWLVLWFAHKVAQGEKVWEFECRKSDVLYISLEDTYHRLQERLARVTNGETGNIWIATTAEVIGKGLEEQLIDFLMGHPSVKFIVVDTLQRIRQIRTEQYSYANDYDVISRLKLLADRFEITILLVHHTRKASAVDPFSLVSGTTGLTGGVDGLLLLVKDQRMDNRAKLYITGRDTLDAAIELVFNDNSVSWDYLGFVGNDRIQRRDKLIKAVNTLVQEESEFQGTATELLARLPECDTLQIKSPNALTRRLNPQRSVLRHEYGILYSTYRDGKARRIQLVKIKDDGQNDDLSVGADIVTTVTTQQ